MCSKIKIIIVAMVVVIAGVSGYFIHDINTRFPKAVVEYYSKDNPLNINNLVITPVESRIWNLNDFNEAYPNVLYQDDFIYSDMGRIITYTLTYENISQEDIKFKPEFSDAWMWSSCLHNGVRKVTGEGTTTFKPNEVQTITLYARAYAGSQVTVSDFRNLKDNNNYLIYQEYPKKKMVKFDWVG